LNPKPDEEARRAWDALPKNAPSPEALPPVTGGLHWTRWLLITFGLIALLAVIFGLLQGRA
jgi:hypothetical protein